MKILIGILLLCFSMSSQAQTWDEIFRQKKTQKKYLLKQIVALKVYAGHLKDGYKIASKGIHSIEFFTNGEFKLHDAFFNSLKVVSPFIVNNGKVEDILDWQKEIKKGFLTLSKLAIYGQNKDYFEDVKDKTLKECEADLEELFQLISSGELEMSDDERLKRLEKIHYRMKEKYQFTHAFIAQAKVLETQIELEKRSIQRVRKYHPTSN